MKGEKQMKQLVITLGSLTAASTLTTLGLWAFDQRVAAAVVGSATMFLWLGLLIVGTVAITAWWTKSTMEAGAGIALKAQESDDKRDVAQIQAVGSLAKVLMRQTRPEYPALPMPQQEADWLPALSEFDVVDGEVKV